MFRRLLTAPPAVDGHLQRVVGGEQRGHQRQVGHGTGAVLGADPAGDGLPFVRVSICWRQAGASAQRRETTARRESANITGSDDWLSHQLPGDWTEELAGDPGGEGFAPQLLYSPPQFVPQAHRLCNAIEERCQAKCPGWAVSALEEWEVWVHGLLERTKNNSSTLRLLHPLSLHSASDGLPPSSPSHHSVTSALYTLPSSPTQLPRNFVAAMEGAINVTQLRSEDCAAGVSE